MAIFTTQSKIVDGFIISGFPDTNRYASDSKIGPQKAENAGGLSILIKGESDTVIFKIEEGAA